MLKLLADLGLLIRTKRLAKGWTQAKLAKMIDVDLRHIYNIERGLVDPKLSTVLRLAVHLDIDLNELKEYIKIDRTISWKDNATLEEA